MEAVKKTDTYTIYQKRSKRYAVKDASRRWLHGDDKVRILVDENLVKVAVAKPKPKEEAPAEPAEPTEASSSEATE